ncbi:MAG: hypothetical protein QF786_00070 [Vicinamibacterales bacterium]|nr:hypothetical protein [Vicinamibacterales bacterium]
MCEHGVELLTPCARCEWFTWRELVDLVDLMDNDQGPWDEARYLRDTA